MDWLMDQLLPAYDFRTRYTRRITAEPAQVWQALQSVTHDELPVSRLLTSLRRLGRTRLTGPVMQNSPPHLLGQQEGREAVTGMVARFWYPRPVAGPHSTTTPEGFTGFAEPGWVKAAMSFQLCPLSEGGTLLAAETRAHATDAAARRAFAAYWMLIRAGGAGFIRMEMLRAIARRAERTQRGNSPVRYLRAPGNKS